MLGVAKPFHLLAGLTCLLVGLFGSSFTLASEPDPSLCQVKLNGTVRDDEFEGIYLLDQTRWGQIPDEFEVAPGQHRLDTMFRGREKTQENFACEPGKQKQLWLKPGKTRDQPAWIAQGGRFQNAGEEMSFQGVGISGEWGRNVWVQVLLADLRGRMDIVRAMDNQTASLRRDYGEREAFHVENLTKSVIMFSWDPNQVASRVQVQDRWLSKKGDLYSRVTLRISRQVLTQAVSPPSCANLPSLVFFDEMIDNKTLDQVAIFCGPSKGGFGDLAQALAGSEGEVWSAKDTIPFPEVPAFCIGDIERNGVCSEKATDYIESISMYRCPSLLPIGQLHKDYSSENTYGCQFR